MRHICFTLAILAALTMSGWQGARAQSYYEDGWRYLYDYDHRVVVRACTPCTEDYQSLWNGDYVRLLGGNVFIYRDGRQVTYGKKVWLEQTGYYTVKRGDYYYLIDEDGYQTGVNGNNLYVLWNGIYVVLKGNHWYLYTADNERLGGVYSNEEISIYWNGYYCVQMGSYYYVATPEGRLINATYSDEEPEITNAGQFRCFRGNSTYIIDTDGRRVY